MTSPPIARRHALSLLGAAGAGAFVFAACGGSNHDASPATTTSSKTRATDAVGSSAAAGATGDVTPAMFEYAAS